MFKGKRRARAGGVTLTIAALALLVGFTPSALASESHGGAKAPINIESISLTSIPGFDEIGGETADFDWINAHGGIDGHQVNLTQCYIGSIISSSPTAAASCAQQAVANNDLAVVGTFSDYDSDVLPTLQAANIADFGDFPQTPIDATNADSYPLILSTVFFDTGLSEELAVDGKCKTIGALISSGLPTTNQAARAISAGAKFYGAKIVAPVLVSTTDADLAPAVATLESEGATCIADAAATNQATAIVTAVSQSGIQEKIAGIGPAFSPRTIAALGPLANGLFIDQTAQVDAQTSDCPGYTTQEKLFCTQMQTYDPSVISVGNADWPTYGASVGFIIVVKYMIAHNMALTAKNFRKAIPLVGTISTGFFAPVSFAQTGPVKGFPRIHAESANFLTIQNDVIVPIDRRNHNVSDAMVKYPNG